MKTIKDTDYHNHNRIGDYVKTRCADTGRQITTRYEEYITDACYSSSVQRFWHPVNVKEMIEDESAYN